MDEQAALPVGPPVAWVPARRPAREPLEGAHVLLRPVRPDDAEALHAVSHPPGGDPAVWTYMGYGPFADVAELRRWLATAETSEDPLFLAVEREGRPLGWASYMRIAPEPGVIEIGNIWFAPAVQRSTAATEAIFLLARHAFDDLGYRRLEWKCDALNAASRRAAERFGFAFEGVFRQHLVVKGRNRDTAWFAIVDADWPAVRAGFDAWLDPGNFDAAGRQRASLRALIARARPG